MVPPPTASVVHFPAAGCQVVYVLCTFQALTVDGSWEDGYLSVAYRHLWTPNLGCRIQGPGCFEIGWWTIPKSLHKKWLEITISIHVNNWFGFKSSRCFRCSMNKKHDKKIAQFMRCIAMHLRLGLWVCISAALANSLLYTSELASWDLGDGAVGCTNLWGCTELGQNGQFFPEMYQIINMLTEICMYTEYITYTHIYTYVH